MATGTRSLLPANALGHLRPPVMLPAELTHLSHGIRMLLFEQAAHETIHFLRRICGLHSSTPSFEWHEAIKLSFCLCRALPSSFKFSCRLHASVLSSST